MVITSDEASNVITNQWEIDSAAIKLLNEDELLQHIAAFEHQFGLHMINDPRFPLTIGFKQYLTDDQRNEDGNPKPTADIDIEQIFEKHRRKIRKLGEFYHRATGIGIFGNTSNDINGREITVSLRINRLIDMVDDAYET